MPLSKNKGKDQAELKDIMAKVAAEAPHLLQTRIYQTGFKDAPPPLHTSAG